MYKISYTGDGYAAEYFFDAKWFRESDVRVFVDGALCRASQYAVEKCAADPEYESKDAAAANDTGVRAFMGGKVVFAAAPAGGAKIDIFRKIALDRLVCYQRTERITPDRLNADFDYLTEYLKDLDESGVSIEEIQNLVEKIASAKDESAAAIQEMGFAKIGDIPDMAEILDGIAALANRLDGLDAALSSVDIPGLSEAADGLSNADYVVESSAPGANPWYRRYKSGWIEQGGFAAQTGSVAASGTYAVSIALLFPMCSADYYANFVGLGASTGLFCMTNHFDKTAGSFKALLKNLSNQTAGAYSGWSWEAKGFAAC